MMKQQENIYEILFILILTSFINVNAISHRESLNIEYHCSGISPQTSLDIDQVLGSWYAVEVVEHREDTKYPKGRMIVDACPYLELIKTDRNQMKLLWEERAGKLEYNFILPDMNNRPGHWLSYGPQNGTMLQMQYSQFAGTVEVTKAVGTHMVLTFCTPHKELYSVVMSRNRHLSRAELRGVDNMLDHRGLRRFSVRETCKDGANQNVINILIITLSLMLIKIFS